MYIKCTLVVQRPNQLKVLISDDEQGQLRELADHAGLTVADWIRQTIRREHAALPTKTRKKP